MDEKEHLFLRPSNASPSHQIGSASGLSRRQEFLFSHQHERAGLYSFLQLWQK